MSPGAGEALLAERIARIPDALAAVAATPAPNLSGVAQRARRIVVTGLGSSSSCARLLAHELDAVDGGARARFVPASALLAPPPGAQDDLLVVFSQGLSPNARLALASPEAWGRVLLVTATGPEGGAGPDAAERRALLARLADAGAIVVTMPGEDENGTLVRVLGPVAGLARAFDLARALGAATAVLDAGTLVPAMGRAAQAAEGEIAARGLPEPDEAIVFVAAGEHATLAENLPRKLLEGWLAPAPHLLDALEAGHGPLQQLHGTRACFLWLERQGTPGDDVLGDALERSLGPSHRLLRLPARLPGGLALFEHEAAANVLLLAGVRARGLDPGEWPGRGAEPPLYTLARPPEAPRASAEVARPALDALTVACRRAKNESQTKGTKSP